MHYGGHWREAFIGWVDEGCPPVARVEVNYEDQTWPADRLLRRMLRCSDVLPGDVYEGIVEDFGIEGCERTYGAVARALLEQSPAQTV